MENVILRFKIEFIFVKLIQYFVNFLFIILKSFIKIDKQKCHPNKK